MSSRTTRASPKRSDAWLAEATAVTGASAFKRSDMMARGIAAAAHAGRPGGVSRGRASHLAVLCAAAVDVDLTDGREHGLGKRWSGAWRSTGWDAEGSREPGKLAVTGLA